LIHIFEFHFYCPGHLGKYFETRAIAFDIAPSCCFPTFPTLIDKMEGIIDAIVGNVLSVIDTKPVPFWSR